MPRTAILPFVLLLSLALGLTLSVPADLAAEAASASAPATDGAGGSPFAGYELLEATYLLRAPDGTLLRVTRSGPAAAWRGGAEPLAAPAEVYSDAPRVRPVLGLQGLLSGWLYRTPETVERIADLVREMWSLLVRMLDYLGVVVLLAGSWGVWFLARPMLPGVPDRAAFLFIFALAAGLWAYVTGLYMSIVYAAGLLLLPAVVAAVLAWLARGVVRLFRRPSVPAP